MPPMTYGLKIFALLIAAALLGWGGGRALSVWLPPERCNLDSPSVALYGCPPR